MNGLFKMTHRGATTRLNAFTLLETAFSLLILVLACQLLLELTHSSRSLADKIKDSRQSPEVAIIQLEQDMADVRGEPGRYDDCFYYKGTNANGKPVAYKVAYRQERNEVVVSNQSGEGYMPLWANVQDCHFNYRAPLLTITLKRFGQSKTIVTTFLIEPVLKEVSDDTT